MKGASDLNSLNSPNEDWVEVMWFESASDENYNENQPDLRNIKESENESDQSPYWNRAFQEQQYQNEYDQ